MEIALAAGERRADVIFRDLYKVLNPDTTYDGWEHETAESKAFYVRGFTWFRDKVLRGDMNITDVRDFIPAMKDRIASRKEWIDRPFKWIEPFGDRQFIDAASPHTRLTPKFHKAVEIIVLCETIADALSDGDPQRPRGVDVYDNMRVEAAVSFIHDFDRKILEKLEQDKTNLMSELLLWTGQATPTVFFDMSNGNSVTHKLACWTYSFLQAKLPNSGIGQVEFKLRRRKRCTPSKNEDIDVKESDLPLEARTALAAQKQKYRI